jgi:hypothetical protein
MTKFDDSMSKEREEYRGHIAALARGGPLTGVLTRKPNPRRCRCFFIGTPRSSTLGSATNEKTQAVGPGFGFQVDILERRSNQ